MKRFRFGLIIIILFLGSMCLGATKYVAIDGNNTTGDGSIGNPWLTISYAFSQISTGDTIKVGAGTYHETANNHLYLNRNITATIESQSGNNDVWVKPNSTSYAIRLTAAGTITFNNINVMPIGASCSFLFDGGGTSDYSVTFNDCVLDMNGLSSSICSTGSGTGESVIYNRCTLTATNATSSGMFYIHSFDVFEVNDCDITKEGTTSSMFYFIEDSNVLKVQDCNMSSNNTVIRLSAASEAMSLDHLIITGNTVTGCGMFLDIYDEDIRFAKICNNTIHSNVSTSEDSTAILTIGRSIGTGTNTLSGFVIKNNTLTKNATTGDCIQLGTICRGAEVSHNTITSIATGNAHGIAVRGSRYNNIHHNIVKSPRPIYQYGLVVSGFYNKIQYNTFYSNNSEAYCFSTDVTNGYKPSNNVITNNIFDASAGTCAMHDTYYPSTCDFDNHIDYNCYVGGSLTTVELGNVYYNVLADLQAKWATWSDTWPKNDAHSIFADPQFMDAANGDFKLKPTSPCLNTGKPTLDSGYTSIGAWQRKSLLR